MQLIKPKSETLYYENCFGLESLGISFYDFFHNSWYGLVWLVDNKSGTGGIPNWKWYCFNHNRPFYFTKIITLICLTLNLLLMSWWFHGCYLFAFLPWCVCVWCLEPLGLTNFFGMLPGEWIKLLINPYESTF